MELSNCDFKTDHQYHYPGWRSFGFYTGQYGADKPNGFGIIVSKLNTIFVGRFKDGVLDGFGAKLYPKGNFYIGQFVDGKQHGQGREKEAG